jgi:hypothetical protein
MTIFLIAAELRHKSKLDIGIDLTIEQYTISRFPIGVIQSSVSEVLPHIPDLLLRQALPSLVPFDWTNGHFVSIPS